MLLLWLISSNLRKISKATISIPIRTNSHQTSTEIRTDLQAPIPPLSIGNSVDLHQNLDFKIVQMNTKITSIKPNSYQKMLSFINKNKTNYSYFNPKSLLNPRKTRIRQNLQIHFFSLNMLSIKKTKFQTSATTKSL